uniref:THAP domain containing protein n=1 Tax=Rhipicephalus appendiculatus TaxID=34631 RepID=A0A131YZ58_RHIAP
MESTTPEPESRPTRNRARRLTEEQLQAMMNSDSEVSDNDPDFQEETIPKGRRSVQHPQSSQDSSPSSEDVDDPDGPPPRKKAVKVKGEPVNKKKKTTAPGEKAKGGPKRSSSWAPVHDVPPPIENPHLYSSWSNDSKVVEPSKKADDKTYYCCVRECESGDTSDKEGLWLFAMPENEELMSLWDERLPIDYERNRPLSPRVCFRHFEKADFVRRQQRLLGLREDAIPLKVELDDVEPRIKQEPS